MIWIVATAKILAILAIYGGLVVGLERRFAPASPAEGTRYTEIASKNKARRPGRVA